MSSVYVFDLLQFDAKSVQKEIESELLTKTKTGFTSLLKYKQICFVQSYCFASEISRPNLIAHLCFVELHFSKFARPRPPKALSIPFVPATLPLNVTQI